MISIFEEEKVPKTWKVINLEAVCEVNPKLDKSIYQDDLQVSFVPMPAVEAESGKIDVSDSRLFSQVKKGYTAFQQHDVLFAKITPCMENGKMAVVPTVTNKLGFGSTEFHVLRPNEGINPHFIYYFVSSKVFRVQAEHNMTGAVGQRRVPAPWLSAEKLPLPPKKEQHRIVAKIEELFSELDKGIESLKTAQQQLKVYRQALLKHAFEGKLTEQWRCDNPDKLESAEQLLERIKQERETRYQQQLEEWKAAVKAWEEKGKEGKKPSKPKKAKVLEELSDKQRSSFGTLPESWALVKIGNVSSVGTGVTPLKSNSNFYASGTIPWVTSGALNNLFVNEATTYVTEAALKETNLNLYPENTLLLAMYGEGKTRGKCSELLISATTNQAIAAIVQKGLEEKTRKYLKWFLIKNYFDIRRMSSGGVQPNLNLGIVENTPFPLCSVDEMNMIVHELESSISVTDEIEKNINEQILKSNALRQSILKKAFSGQLVPQDPNDEPASELLKRIAEEKVQLEAEAKAAKAVVRKATKRKAKTK